MISSSTSTPSSSSSSSSERSTIASTSIKRTGGNVNVNSVIEKSSLLIRNLQRLLNEKTPTFGDELQKVWLKKLNYEIVSFCGLIQQKPIQRIQEFPLNSPKEILGAKVVSGKFGTQVLLELEKSVVFLPKRTTTVLEPLIDELKGNYIIFEGIRKFNNHEQVYFNFLHPWETSELEKGNVH
ncbi:hypothetical protein ABEB36_012821 [Hypothenemus hampei]|uniref:Uncharacterized protein n=1 Tax=Hypothenemus hampei TaxID=57062 RepID=A0ABD1E5W1_HYPHA